MDRWTIDYYSEKTEAAILKLPAGILARYLHLADLIEEFGLNLGMPHTKSLGDKLFELRVKSKEGIGRVLYCTRIGKRVVVLHCFIKKTNRIPVKEIKIARSRLKEVLENDS